MSAPTYWSQPNQQVVRDGDPVGIISDGPDPQSGGGSFDPSAHTVTEVEEYLDAHPGEAEEILELERSGKARVSLVGGDEE